MLLPLSLAGVDGPAIHLNLLNCLHFADQGKYRYAVHAQLVQNDQEQCIWGVLTNVCTSRYCRSS